MSPMVVGSPCSPLSDAFERPGIAPLALWRSSGKIAEERAIELPGTKLFDGRMGIGKGAAADAQKVELTSEILAVGTATDDEIGGVGY